jgi:hypothetical protein
MTVRTMLAGAAAVFALSISLVVFQGTPGAVATQGQPVLAGGVNTATAQTVVQNTNTSVFCDQNTVGGLLACGNVGVTGSGTLNGVIGLTDTGTGVFGVNTGLTGIGVEGETDGTGSGVYGDAPTQGVGVFGDTQDGIGMEARATGTGTALKVVGKATFSRSGLASVPAGAKQVKVTMAGVTKASMILATVQQSGGFSVVDAVPAAGSFTIAINKAPVSGTTVKVAFMVLN